MMETKLTCQYCGEHFETKSDLQDHEMNCLAAGQAEGQRQQEGGNIQQTTGRQKQTSARQKTTAPRTRSAGSGETWNEG